MTNQEIETKLRSLIQNEREITNEILSLIGLADQRRIFAEKGYGSLFEWLVRGFGYSESAAQRRIQAARLIRSVPEVSQKLSKGEVSLSSISKTQSMIRLHEIQSGEKLSNEQKSEVVKKIENKTSHETEKTLIELFPETASKAKADKKTSIDEKTSRIALNISNETLKELDRVKELLSHALPHGSLGDVIQYLSKDFLKRRDPLRKPVTINTSKVGTVNTAAAKQCVTEASKFVTKELKHIDRSSCAIDDIKKPDETSAATKRRVSVFNKPAATTAGGALLKDGQTSRRHSQPDRRARSQAPTSSINLERVSAALLGGVKSQVVGSKSLDASSAGVVSITKSKRPALSPKLKRQVFHSSNGKCTFKDHSTGRICGSSFQVEVDHIYPRALGGEDTFENLRCLCRMHNQFVAAQALGGKRAIEVSYF